MYTLNRLRCSEDGHIDYWNSLGNDVVNYEQGKITMAKINPWSLELCKKQAEKLHQELIDAEYVAVSQSKYPPPTHLIFRIRLRISFAEYILLENVTARFRHPSILDLKMGKRQYADIDSDEKRQSKIQKCELSTSSTLGVRLCGMQVRLRKLCFLFRNQFFVFRFTKLTAVDTSLPINIEVDSYRLKVSALL